MRSTANTIALSLVIGFIFLIVALLIVSAFVANAAHDPAHTAGEVTSCNEGISWEANSENDIVGYVLLNTVGKVFPFPHPPELVPCADVEIVNNGQQNVSVMAMNSGDQKSPPATLDFFLQRPPTQPKGLAVN